MHEGLVAAVEAEQALLTDLLFSADPSAAAVAW
jgi:hypothetical protein